MFAVHVHLGLSSRPELISVERGCRGGGGRGRERACERAGGSGLGGWPPVQMISLVICVFGRIVFFQEWGRMRWGQRVRGRWGGCVLGRVRFNRKLTCHKGSL